MAVRPGSGHDHAGEVVDGGDNDDKEVVNVDMEDEGEDEDSVRSPGDLSECRSGPPRRDQDTALCQAGVLGGPSQSQPSGTEILSHGE